MRKADHTEKDKQTTTNEQSKNTNVTSDILKKRILSGLPFEPSPEQEKAAGMLSRFVCGETASGIFILKGYAGTGKTSMIASVVNALPPLGRRAVLAAPTGRAAKVMGRYSGQKAFTVHKMIYSLKKSEGGVFSFALKPNRYRDALFIVDEASMITDRPGESLSGNGASLMDDLLQYVFSGKGCRLLLVGDTAQLPPVGYSDSPALEPSTFETGYGMDCSSYMLTQVYRQAGDSAILANATAIRKAVNEGITQWGALKFTPGADFVRLCDGYDIQSALEGAYSDSGQSETIIITRSNKRAGMFNQQIRSRVMLSEGEISTGDILMVVKNNYFWVDESSPCGFIANGDLAEVMSVRRTEEVYGLHFARVELCLTDYPQMPKFEAVVMLDTIYSDTAGLAEDKARVFFEEVMKDYEDLPVRRKYEELAKNEYFNAIQVKFGYAVTCHKAQGGGWDNVFVEQVWMPEPKLSKDYLRWLYTAITRARKKVYLIGFGDEFF